MQPSSWKAITVSLSVALLAAFPGRGSAVPRGPDATLPPALTGRVAATAALLADARKTLGDHGCLAIRSAERWQAVRRLLAGLGWKPPAKHPLISGPDFDRHMLILVYKNGDEADQFAVRRFDGRGKPPALEVVMGYVIYKKRPQVVERCNFLVAAVPRLPRLDVTVSTYHPFNGGPYATPAKAMLEWRGVVGTDAGDVADGLRARIAVKAAKVRSGRDILARFTLEYADGAQVKFGQFVGRPGPAWVWDGKYSNGYRNHAFEVRGPDGKVHFLQPKEIRKWDKNVPHPVEVKAGKPYVLPEWFEGRFEKSLKALGLDTARPGMYQITGIYTEAGGPARWNGADSTEHKLWGGTVASNTVTVEVAGR